MAPKLTDQHFFQNIYGTPALIFASHFDFGIWFTLSSIKRLQLPFSVHFYSPYIKVVSVYFMKAYRGSKGTAPLILNLGTR
jgi:hypothetical protein